MYPETRAEISGIISDNSGNPVPFANVRVYEINSERWYWDNTDSDGKYEVNIFPVIDNGQYNLWVWGGEKRAYMNISDLNKRDRREINVTVGNASKISGEV